MFPDRFLEYLKLYKFDGCSGQQSKLWKMITGSGPAWEYCCDEHDLAYNQGGPLEWRAWADANLRKCMTRDGHPIDAWIYWIAVRLLGGAYWGKGDNRFK